MPTQEELQLEHTLAEALRRKQCEQWLAENREELDAYNQHVETVGVFSDNVRSL
jgi:antitoxin CcdA